MTKKELKKSGFKIMGKCKCGDNLYAKVYDRSLNTYTVMTCIRCKGGTEYSQEIEEKKIAREALPHLRDGTFYNFIYNDKEVIIEK